jgi:hypothetical protein
MAYTNSTQHRSTRGRKGSIEKPNNDNDQISQSNTGRNTIQ